MKNNQNLNYEQTKERLEFAEKLIKKLVRNLPVDTMIQELKRRKITHFDWESGKYKFNSQQPEVNACQGGGETMQSNSLLGNSLPITMKDDVLGKTSRNPPADINSKEKLNTQEDKK